MNRKILWLVIFSVLITGLIYLTAWGQTGSVSYLELAVIKNIEVLEGNKVVIEGDRPLKVRVFLPGTERMLIEVINSRLSWSFQGVAPFTTGLVKEAAAKNIKTDYQTSVQLNVSLQPIHETDYDIEEDGQKIIVTIKDKEPVKTAEIQKPQQIDPEFYKELMKSKFPSQVRLVPLPEPVHESNIDDLYYVKPWNAADPQTSEPKKQTDSKTAEKISEPAPAIQPEPQAKAISEEPSKPADTHAAPANLPTEAAPATASVNPEPLAPESSIFTQNYPLPTEPNIAEATQVPEVQPDSAAASLEIRPAAQPVELPAEQAGAETAEPQSAAPLRPERPVVSLNNKFSSGKPEPNPVAVKPAVQATATMVADILYRSENNAIQVLIKTDGIIGHYVYSTASQPNRLIIDFPGLTLATPKKTYAVSIPGINSVRLGQHPEMARAVIDFSAGLPSYNFYLAKKGLIIELRP